MPHAMLTITGGVVTNETPALNSAGISSTQLIRLKPDPKGLTLPEKLGGWQRYYTVPAAAKVTAIWPWEDTNANKWVGFGTSVQLTGANAGQSQLGVLDAVFDATTGLYTASQLTDITPTTSNDSIEPVYDTTKGSSTVTVTDATFTGVTNYDTVYIATPVSVGGIVLFGLYACAEISNTQYSIASISKLGGANPATYTTSSSIAITSGSSSGSAITVGFSAVTSAEVPTAGEAVTFAGVDPSAWDGTWIVTSATTTQIVVASTTPAVSWSSGGTISNQGIVPLFTTANGSALVTVTLPDHGYSAGDTFPVLVQTTVGGIALLGNYIVQSVADTYTFNFVAGQAATSDDLQYENGGNVQNVYATSAGPQPPPGGYGVGGYGLGGYGSGSSFVAGTGTPIGCLNWTLDNWGQILVACPSSSYAVGSAPDGIQFQPIFVYDPTAGAITASVVSQGPPVNDGILVAMPQRQIIAWGSTFTGILDPLEIRWCDVNNYAVWIGTVTNQAGSYRLPRGSRIVGAIQAPQQILVWTDIAVWSMQYTGLPYVYSFNQIGAGCGMIAKKASGNLNGVTYWMGLSQFFSLSGEGVQPIVCPIWDVIFQNLNPAEIDQIICAPNSMFGEVTWYFPAYDDATDEATNYVRYNVMLGSWDFGVLVRTAWSDVSVVGPPLGADDQFVLYQHEVSPDADGNALEASFTTGYLAISDGDYKVTIDQVWPDFKYGYTFAAQNAQIQLTFNAVDYPGDTPTTYGPYTLTQSTEWISPRIRTRLMSITVASSDIGSFWRIGALRYRFQTDGKY